MEPSPTFDWKAKILDNLISQKTLFGITFAVMIVVVDLTPTQADTLTNLIYATLGASAVKSAASAWKK